MKKILAILILISGLSSCKKDILDIPPKDRLSEDAVWSDENLIKAYHNALYNGIPHGFYIHMYSKYTDEANGGTAPCCGADIMARMTYTPDNIAGVAGGDFWGGHLYYWDRGYQYIRKANVFLEKMAGDDIKFDSKERLIAETKFLRAFMYFELIKRYGGVPIAKESYELGADVSFKRSSFDECVAFIENDLDDAMTVLPVSYPSSDGNFGRATQDACKALRSRLLLYAASPLFNPSNDQQKWQKAADAAAVLLNNGYSLYPDYRKAFILPSGAANSELIFAMNFTSTNGHQAPMHNLSRRYGAYGGWWASNGPTQNLVDDYDMINGKAPFNYVGGVKTINPASGYDPDDPYANRDPRFDATIIHDGTVYRGDLFEMWVSTTGTTWGFDSYKQSGDNPRTGYVLKKFMPDADIPLNWQTTYTNPWPHFRLAEIYLNYAEAKFELGDEATCREYLSKVRVRVGMPAIPATITGPELRRTLYNERRIELAFEGHRFFDIRRWKIARDVENRPIMGMDIFRNPVTMVKTYNPVQVFVRTFQEKMYLLPVDNNEILRNKELVQTQGW